MEGGGRRWKVVGDGGGGRWRWVEGGGGGGYKELPKTRSHTRSANHGPGMPSLFLHPAPCKQKHNLCLKICGACFLAFGGPPRAPGWPEADSPRRMIANSGVRG